MTKRALNSLSLSLSLSHRVLAKIPLFMTHSHSLSLVTGANGRGVRPGAGWRKQTQETAEGSEAWPHLGGSTDTAR